MTEVVDGKYVHTDVAYENTQYGYDFNGKTVRLMANIDLGDEEDANTSLIFYPIGYYYTDDENNDGVKGDYYSAVSNFSGKLTVTDTLFSTSIRIPGASRVTTTAITTRTE